MWLALFFSLLSLASEPHEAAQWKALLHFESSSSLAEGSKFFLESAPNLKGEWDSTLRAFRENPESLCRFPARAIYLREVLKEAFPEPKNSELCDRWHKWREAISAKGIELVFASGYLSSPSSMYGHTLLKFPRSGKTEGQDLLDYTLSFGAETGNAGGLAYVWKGLSGGFNGIYATAPFYLKVREYNFVENRDFWIYPIRLDPPALEKLVAHAWEIREMPFPYFFLRKNCSYFLLEFLKVAFPEKRSFKGIFFLGHPHGHHPRPPGFFTPRSATLFPFSLFGIAS